MMLIVAAGRSGRHRYMKLLLSVIIVLLVPGGSPAQSEEFYVRFHVRGSSDVQKLAKTISIAGVAGDTILAFVTERERSVLETMGYRLEELPLPGMLDQHDMASSPQEMMEWDRYPSYQAYVNLMRDLAERYPALCLLDTIGLSAQGRLILALKVSKNVSVREAEPQLLYSSSMHGNELTGFIMLLRLADYLLFQYGKVTPEAVRVTTLLDNMEIYLNPLFNPDGAYRLGGDTTISNATRGNVNGVDLNRNFPDRISSPVNGTRGRQPETAAMMRWTFNHNFSVSANFHGGAQVVLYPWSAGAPSGQYAACPDDKVFVHIAKVYAAPNPDIMHGGFTDGISNSCDWYEVLGGRQDWMYAWQGGHEVTVELSSQYIVPDLLLPAFWNNNKESLLAYLELGLKGLRGRITAAGGLPVKASIDVLESPNSPSYSDPVIGAYHRPLLPGTYTVVVSAYGYQTDTVRNVAVTDSIAARVDVELQRATPVVSETSQLPTRFALNQNYPNPFNPSTIIRYTIPERSTVRISIFNVLGQITTEAVNEIYNAGSYEYSFDAAQLSSGIYFYRIEAVQERLSGKVFVDTKKMVLLR
jgi:hypothetical protein